MPLAFLFTGGIPWRLIGIVVGFVLAFFCYFEITHMHHLEAQLDAEARIANNNAIVAESARHAVDQANAIATQAALDAKVIQRKFSTKRRIIIDAPQADDGPLAPVLRRTLDELPDEDGDKVGDNRHAATSGKPDDMSGWP